MRFKKTVKAIMKQNINTFCQTGDPDVIYKFLTAKLLESGPSDLLLLHDLLKREVEEETDTSTGGLSALTKGFFSGMRDVLCGILAERIITYKEAKDFLSLGQIFAHALQTDPKILHEVGQLVYHENYGPNIIEHAQKSKMYRYHDELDEHFRMIQENTKEEEEKTGTDQSREDLERYHSVKAEIRMIHLIDVVSCFIDANPMNLP